MSRPTEDQMALAADSLQAAANQLSPDNPRALDLIQVKLWLLFEAPNSIDCKVLMLQDFVSAGALEGRINEHAAKGFRVLSSDGRFVIMVRGC